MSAFPNPGQIRTDARKRWEAEQPKPTIEERVRENMGWIVVVMGSAFFALSVPHTVYIANILQPLIGNIGKIGYVAPLGIELGLLGLALWRKSGLEVSKMMKIMEALVFFIAVLVNVAGSLMAVIENSGLNEMSTSEILNNFGALSIQYQISLVVALVFGFAIPVCAVVAGELIAGLSMQREKKSSRQQMLATAWADIEKKVIYEALNDAAIALGHNPREASIWAKGISPWEGAPNYRPNIIRSSSDGRVSEVSDRTSDGQTVSVRTSYGHRRTSDGLNKVVEYHRANPAARDMSTRAVGKLLGVSPDTVSRARQAMLAQPPIEEDDTSPTQAVEVPILEDARV